MKTRSGLALIVLAWVTRNLYLQIEWHGAGPVVLTWYYLAQIAGVVGWALFFTAAGVTAGRLRELPWPLLVRRWLGPYTLVFVVSVVLSGVVLRRFDPWLGQLPVRDATDLLTHLVLPPPILAPAFVLVVATILARFTGGWPTVVTVGGLTAAAILAGVDGDAAYLLIALFFFLFGWRRPVLPPIGRGTPGTLVLVVPMTALAGTVLLRPLSIAEGFLQVSAPLILTAAIMLAGAFVGKMTAGALVLVLVTAGCTSSPAEITLTFGGDVHFEGRIDQLLSRPDTVFGAARTALTSADVTLVNLETPITTGGAAQAKTYVFRAAPAAADALRLGGVDAVSLANNHSMDYGRPGLTDTISALGRAGVGSFGAGSDLDTAFRPWRTTVRGVRIAVFGFSQVDDLAGEWTAGPSRAGIALAFDLDRAAAAVTAARADSDLVVVMPHWGVEGDRCPSRAQQRFAARMARAGADLVVGAHAHVLQGAGRLGDAFVAYGLGNLLWYSAGLYPPFSARSGLLTLTMRGRTVHRATFTPVVAAGSGQPQPLTGWRETVARDNFTALTGCTGLRSP